MMATGYGSGAVFGFAGTDKVCLMPPNDENTEGSVCADNHTKMRAVKMKLSGFIILLSSVVGWAAILFPEKLDNFCLSAELGLGIH